MEDHIYIRHSFGC